MISIKRPRIRVLIAVLASSLGTSMLLVGGFLIWMDRVYTEYSTLLRLSRYRVVIPADPGIAGKLYTIGRDDTFLLVLTSRDSRRPERYHIKLGSQEIGAPEFPQYVPLPRSAIVDRCSLDGYPMDTVVAADWEVKNDWREVHIRIRGFAWQVKRNGPAARRENAVAPSEKESEETISEMIRLAYQKEIILLAD